jgi:hypothetical protein
LITILKRFWKINNKFYKLKKKYYNKNKAQISGIRNKYYKQNSNQILPKQKTYYKKHQLSILEKKKLCYLQKRSNLSVWYKKNRSTLLAKSCKYYKENRSARKRYAACKYKKHKKEKSRYDKLRYAIKEPCCLHRYIKKIQKNLRCDKEVCDKIVEAFTFNNSESTDHSYSEISLVASKIVSKRLIGNAIQVRRKRVGSLLKTHREIEKIVIKSKDDFGEEGHTCTTEPYYYDASYSLTHHQLYPINKYGKCVLVAPTYTGRGTNVWKCTPECKAIPQWEVDAIVKIRKAFDGSIPALRKPCHPRAVKAVQIYTFPSL